MNKKLQCKLHLCKVLGVFFFFVSSQWHINLCGLLNAETTLVEEHQHSLLSHPAAFLLSLPATFLTPTACSFFSPFPSSFFFPLTSSCHFPFAYSYCLWRFLSFPLQLLLSSYLFIPLSFCLLLLLVAFSLFPSPAASFLLSLLATFLLLTPTACGVFSLFPYSCFFPLTSSCHFPFAYSYCLWRFLFLPSPAASFLLPLPATFHSLTPTACGVFCLLSPPAASFPSSCFFPLTSSCHFPFAYSYCLWRFLSFPL